MFAMADDVGRGGSKVSNNEGGGRRSHIRFPTINRSGADVLVVLTCVAEPERSNPARGPTTLCSGFAATIKRMNDAMGVRDPPPVTLTTEPEIGGGYDLIGDSCDLAVAIGYLLAIYGATTRQAIFATGRLPGTSGRVSAVEAIARKVDLVHEAAAPGSYFIYPQDNVAGSGNGVVRDKLERLRKERGVRCIPIGRLDQVSFLWTRRSGALMKTAKKFGTFVVPPALVMLTIWLATTPGNPALRARDESLDVTVASINTANKKGYYHTVLCPLVLEVFSRSDLEEFKGRKCTPSDGTKANIEIVLSNLTNLAFVQLDVWSEIVNERNDVKNTIYMIDDEIACEGLWMVTKNPHIRGYEDVVHSIADIEFIVPSKASGPAQTFEYLRHKVDKLKDASVPINATSVDQMLRKVAARSINDKVVGFLVQFIEPDDNIVDLAESLGLRLFGMSDPDILSMEVDNRPVYRPQEFALRHVAILPWATSVSTACVNVGLITGRKDALGSRAEQEKQARLIDALQRNKDRLHPRGSLLAVLGNELMNTVRHWAEYDGHREPAATARDEL
jgi:hypothetical protein